MHLIPLLSMNISLTIHIICICLFTVVGIVFGLDILLLALTLLVGIGFILLPAIEYIIKIQKGKT